MADDDEGPAIRLVPSRDPNTPRASDGLAGNPFGAPADNPFATQPSSAPANNPFAKSPPSNPGGNPFGVPSSSNPFNPASSSGEGAPIAGGNPFATQPSSDAGSSPFSPQPTSTPFSPPAADGGSLEFDLPSAMPPAASGKAHKAELDEWNRSMTTGEFSLQGQPIDGDRSKVITGEMKRPSEEQLQSAGRPPPHHAPTAQVEASGGGGASRIVAFALGGLVLLAALGLGGKIVYTRMTKKKPVVVDRSPTETDAFVRKMQADAENAPDCWATDDGYSFV